MRIRNISGAIYEIASITPIAPRKDEEDIKNGIIYPIGNQFGSKYYVECKLIANNTICIVFESKLEMLQFLESIYKDGYYCLKDYKKGRDQFFNETVYSKKTF